MDPRFGLWQGWFQTEAVAMEHRKNRAGLAQERWLVSAATATRDYDGLHCRALRWLGRRLIRWGWRLQQHYDVPAFYPARGMR